MHLCTIATVIVHIYIVVVVRAFNILVFFDSVGYVRENGSEWGNNKKLQKNEYFIE